MLSRVNLRFIAFNHRVRWAIKDEKFTKQITTELYKQQQNKKQWTIIDNPKPIVTKQPHLETLYTKVLQDITNRYQLMIGKTINAQYGINCYGAHITEILYGSVHTALEMPVLEVRERCRNYAIEAIDTHVLEGSKWGVLCGDHYLTMEKDYEATVLEEFARLLNQSIVRVFTIELIFRGNKIVYWSVTRHLFLDEIEMQEEKEVRSAFFVSFEVLGKSI